MWGVASTRVGSWREGSEATPKSKRSPRRHRAGRLLRLRAGRPAVAGGPRCDVAGRVDRGEDAGLAKTYAGCRAGLWCRANSAGDPCTGADRRAYLRQEELKGRAAERGPARCRGGGRETGGVGERTPSLSFFNFLSKPAGASPGLDKYCLLFLPTLFASRPAGSGPRRIPSFRRGPPSGYLSG